MEIWMLSQSNWISGLQLDDGESSPTCLMESYPVLATSSSTSHFTVNNKLEHF